MSKKKQEPVVPYNHFFCEKCNQGKMSPDQFKVHLVEKHQIHEASGTRRMLMHTDGDTWFGYQWEWTIGGMKFLQITVDKRCPEDQMYWDSHE